MRGKVIVALCALILLVLAGQALALNHKATLLGTRPTTDGNTPGESQKSFEDGRGVKPAVQNSPIVGPSGSNEPVQPPVGNNTGPGQNPSDLDAGTVDDAVLCALNAGPC